MKFSPKRACKVFGFSLAAAALFFIGSEAQAQSINGNITFDGSATVLDAAGVKLSSDLTTAAALDFNTGNNYQEVTFGTDDFAPYVSMWDNVTFQNFTFSPALNPSPVDPLWTVDGFSFKLTSIAIDTRNAGLLSLIGTGILAGNGYDATDSVFNFISQNGDGSTWELSFSPSPVSTPVPAAIFFVTPVLAGLFGCSRSRRGVKSTA